MSDRLQRMLEKVRAKRDRRRAAETILIACARPEDVPRRVDVLIAARNPELIYPLRNGRMIAIACSGCSSMIQ